MVDGTKYLAVNADDFGFTRDVNAGIIEGHRNGILTSTTLMANGVEFDDAVRLAREHPTLDIGVHFVLVSGHSVLDASTSVSRHTVSELIKASRVAPYPRVRRTARSDCESC